MSPRLALHLLGPPQIYLDNEPLTLERRKALALLAYLAVEPGGHSRHSLSALLWPDYSQSNAFKSLRQVLWEIQKTVGEGVLTADRGTLALNSDPDQIWLDVREFNSLFVEGCAQDGTPLRVSLLGDAAKLYRNHFLTGFSLKDAHPFNDWAFAESEDLRHKLSTILSRLSEDYCAKGQAAEAVPHARRLVALDPLNEIAHRQLMEVYLQAGQHSAALKQYQACEQILRKELNLDPQPETRELYKKIRRGQVSPIPIKEQTETIAPPHNLPHPLTTFLERQKEQHEIIDLITKKRFVTLVGTGGIGKTTLALQAARKLLNNYPNGVWFITLESLSDPALTTQTVAAVFDIREGADRSLLDRLIDSLQAKTSLLIFDNCEHLLGACAELVTTLLTRCPNIKILATSREGLGVTGEAIYTVPSLPLPEPDIESVERLSEFESVQLFSERAALAVTSFQLTGENIRTVVDICRKVEGIPLAIELAAARVNMLQVEEILKQLHNSFALLASDNKVVLPRQQTLQASVDWSWGLLSESEQIFLRQLSVFAGGWTLESAEAVCEGDVLDLTGALVKKSLVVVEQEAGGETRYHFHEIVRQYARDKLINSGDEANVCTRHLCYFVDLSGRAQSELRGLSRVDWMERLNHERNNLRAALHWAERTDIEAGLLLASRLMRYWESSDLREGRQWLETLLARAKSTDYPLAKAQALHAYGWLLIWLQTFDQAHSTAEECLSQFRAAGDRAGEADALILLGTVFQFKYDLETAMELGEQALRLSRALGDSWREANSLYYLGWDTRDYQRMFTYWGKAISLFRKVGDQVCLANTLGVLGQFRVLHGDFELGEAYLDEAVQLWQANKRANVWENPKIAKSIINLMRGDYERAQVMLQEVMIIAEETGNIMSQLWAQVRLGHVALHSGDLNEAHRLFRKTAQDFGKDAYIIGTVFALEGMAGLCMAVGKPQEAARLIGWADAMRVKVFDPRPNIEQADIDKIITACVAKMGEVEFSNAYDAGQTMTFDEAVAYALES